MSILHLLLQLAHHAQPGRLPSPVPLVPDHVLELLAVDDVRVEQRIAHLFAVDFGHSADAAAVHVAEHRDAVALGERAVALAGVPL